MSEKSEITRSRLQIQQLEMRGITKRFPGVLANSKIDFDVHASEVHALLGENGAGKSTLMKILYGMYHPDDGDIFINGERVKITSPTAAINCGIGMIHQHFMLVPTLTVAENVALGLPSSRGPLTDMQAVSSRIINLADQYGLQIDPSAYIWQLSVGQQQRVEIIKALYRGAALLILDEPTAVLTPQEVDELFAIMRQMMLDGYGLIFISHKLHEVIEISNRITVLRDGYKVGTRLTTEVDKKDLANWMVGHDVDFISRPKEIIRGAVRLQLKNITCESDRGTEGLCDINLDLYSGEILGVAGVSGNGQRELAEVMAGLRRPSSGKILLEGEDITHLSPDKLIKKMVSYIPEERMRDGMVKDFTIAENMILREHDQPAYSKHGFLKLRNIAAHTNQLINQYNVKTPSQKTLAKSLSGGNIQKIVLARELSRNPSTIIAAQPTRGLDIGAAEYVREQLLIQRKNDTAVLLISEDLDEILALSDRIAVIYEGKIIAVLDRDEATKDEIGLLMAGVNPHTEEVGFINKT